MKLMKSQSTSVAIGLDVFGLAQEVYYRQPAPPSRRFMICSAVRVAEALFGLIVVVAVSYDVFQSVVLPRPAINKFILVRVLFRSLWVFWRWIGTHLSPLPRREGWLAAFGPIGLAGVRDPARQVRAPAS